MSVTSFVPKGPIYRDDNDKHTQIARNGYNQATYIFFTVSNWPPGQRVDPSLLLKLQEIAINQIYRCAGNFRDGHVSLEDASGPLDHAPPDSNEVEGLVGQMCAYINERWSGAAAVHLAAYAMWRVNWIHPFFGGNGRTARAFAYLVFCLKLGFAWPADEKNLPELIVENRAPYYAALRSADGAWREGRLDLKDMEEFLSSLLAQQFVTLHNKATGKIPNV